MLRARITYVYCVRMGSNIKMCFFFRAASLGMLCVNARRLTSEDTVPRQTVRM